MIRRSRRIRLGRRGIGVVVRLRVDGAVDVEEDGVDREEGDEDGGEGFEGIDVRYWS